MSRINTLHINNFKFFDEQEPIILGGKHLLLYGENGSGKSSIYWALYTLFEASLKKDDDDVKKYFLSLKNHPQSLVNIYAPVIPATGNTPEHFNSFIEINTDNVPAKTFTLSLLDTVIRENIEARQINQASDFLSYKVLFKFQDFWNGEPINLANIFTGYILPYVNFAEGELIRNGKTVTLTNAWEMYSEIEKGPGMTTNAKGHKIQVYKNSAENKAFDRFVSHFEEEFQKLIDFINVNSPQILQDLGYDINFSLQYRKLWYKKADKRFDFKPFTIELNITSYLGKKITIKRPQSFLNEAKITALGLSIRLSILKQRINEEAGDILKFIVFDDFMISLDMNNRDRLIDYILEPENKYLQNYQLLFLTHDKSFYDFLAYKIGRWDKMSNWICKEMYTGKKENSNVEFPILIESELEFIDRAKKYYLARDYTASAIYIRKELEKIISERLPNESKFKSDGSFISLQQMWNHLVERFNALSKPIDKHTQELFTQTKLLVLNPQAHFQQISLPLYKVELDKAFELIDKLINDYPIPNSIIILDRDMEIEFNHPNINYSVRFILETDFSINSLLDLDKQIKIPRCKILHWQFKGIDFWNVEKNDVTDYDVKVKPLSLKLNEIILMNSSKNGMEISIDSFLENSKLINSLWNLKELCDKSKIAFEPTIPPNKYLLKSILK